ncbi:MAG TPA: sigma-70 family RNA polymerase sigma factor, partial [Xanthobacteraceae bacterium]|nr:sigma-70 family RNA polymerase sigma factor [Xanthobacteraceae bacterium]
QSFDERLLERVAKGDSLAMRAMFARHNVRVHRFVLRLVRDEALAQDVVNDVFLDVWRNAGQFKGETSQVSTWIMAIARFKAISSLRRRRDEQLDDAEATTIPDSADDPETAIQKKDRVAILRRCMSHLSGVHREIIELAYYQDKSVKEVAGMLGVPENTVKTRMFHARKRMSELLHEAGINRTYQ